MKMVQYIWRFILYQYYNWLDVNKRKKFTIRESCINYLSLIDTHSFVKYIPKDGNNIFINANTKSLVGLNVNLININKTLKNKGFINTLDYSGGLTQNPLDTFLTQHDGYYTDILRSITVLKEQGLILCQYLEKGEYEKSGDDEHNYRVLRYVLESLHDTSKTLSKLSLTLSLR